MAKKQIIPRNIYDEVVDEGIRFEDPSLTWQDEADACDVNKILKDYDRTGMIRHMNSKSPQYGDFSNLPNNLHEAFMAVEAANLAFKQLPAKLREEINNDPRQLDSYLANPANKEKLVKLGLMHEVVKTEEPQKEAPKE